MTERWNLRMGEWHVARGRGEFRMTLGSCVGLFLHDPVAKVAGAAHIVLPFAPSSFSRDAVTDESDTGRYADTAVVAITLAMQQLGARLNRTIADLAGGGTMFASAAERRLPHAMQIGRANIEATLNALTANGIGVRRKTLGGKLARKVVFNIERGDWQVREIDSTSEGSAEAKR